jgi:hypothetical protein
MLTALCYRKYSGIWQDALTECQLDASRMIELIQWQGRVLIVIAGFDPVPRAITKIKFGNSRWSGNRKSVQLELVQSVKYRNVWRYTMNRLMAARNPPENWDGAPAPRQFQANR